jgi:hypothetical protein
MLDEMSRSATNLKRTRDLRALAASRGSLFEMFACSVQLLLNNLVHSHMLT